MNKPDPIARLRVELQERYPLTDNPNASVQTLRLEAVTNFVNGWYAALHMGTPGPGMLLVSVQKLHEIYALIDPPPMRVHDETFVFVNPHAADTLKRISALVRDLYKGCEIHNDGVRDDTPGLQALINAASPMTLDAIADLAALGLLK